MAFWETDDWDNNFFEKEKTFCPPSNDLVETNLGNLTYNFS